jgi:hypothetical protein
MNGYDWTVLNMTSDKQNVRIRSGWKWRRTWNSGVRITVVIDFGFHNDRIPFDLLNKRVLLRLAESWT